jgi:cell fate regulator YaaT (PSP1 superfamily)
MYEYDQYVEAIKTLPRRRRKVITPMGEGRVVQILPLRQAVIVDLPNVGPRQFTKEALDRAEKIENGEEVPPLPDVDAKPNVVVSRPEDQEVIREQGTQNQSNRKKTSSKRRGRTSRRSKRRNQ